MAWTLKYNIKGQQGNPGNDGADGAPGTNGTNGSNGTNGTNGADGSVWRNGSGVPSNGSGVNGDYYLDTANGDVYKRVTGAYVLQGNIKGVAGTNGAPGAVWRSGSGVPSNGLGIDGDYYLNTANSDVYFKASGTYSVVVNIKGATGLTGAAGADGADGSNGVGVPTGGTTGQQLTKIDATDFNTQWSDPIADSPDRFNGSATANVSGNMADKNLSINGTTGAFTGTYDDGTNSGTWQVNAVKDQTNIGWFKDDNTDGAVITFGSDAIVNVLGTGTLKGNADHSANYVAESYVQKGYVDTVLPVRITKGTTAARLALTPSEGDMHYDTDLHAFYGWNGSTWIEF